MSRSTIVSLLGWAAIFGLLAPVLQTAWISFSPDSFLTPPTGAWSLRWYRAFAADGRWTAAAARSLFVGTMAAFVSVAAGAPAAVALRHLRGPRRRLVTLILLLPAVVPLAALGTGLLPVAYASGLWGATSGLILVHATLGLPVVELVVRTHLSERLDELEAAGAGLGADSWNVFRRITLPLLRPALLAAGISVFVLSLNESLVTLFLATGTNETLPAVIWPQLRFSASPLVAVASCATALTGIGGILLVLRTVGVGRLR